MIRYALEISFDFVKRFCQIRSSGRDVESLMFFKPYRGKKGSCRREIDFI